jgi:DNA polymerase-3 subunit alpha
MAMITIEDLDGQVDGVIFADALADVNKRYPDAVAVESIVFVRGRIDRRRETPSIIVTDVIPIGESIPKLTTGIALKMDQTHHKPGLVPQLKQVLQSHTGNVRVYLQIATAAQKVVLQLGKDCCVRPVKGLVDDLESILGNGRVQLLGDGTRRARRLEQQKLFRDDAAADAQASAVSSDEMLSGEIEEELRE